jgi:hypothetical protein
MNWSAELSSAFSSLGLNVHALLRIAVRDTKERSVLQ